MEKASPVGRGKWKCEGGISQLHRSSAEELFRTERKVGMRRRGKLPAAAAPSSDELRAAAAARWAPDDLCQPCGPCAAPCNGLRGESIAPRRSAQRFG